MYLKCYQILTNDFFQIGKFVDKIEKSHQRIDVNHKNISNENGNDLIKQRLNAWHSDIYHVTTHAHNILNSDQN